MKSVKLKRWIIFIGTYIYISKNIYYNGIYVLSKVYGFVINVYKIGVLYLKDFMFTLAAIILYSIIVLGLYKVLSKFVLNKIKINKWIIFVLAIMVFLLPPFLFPNLPKIVLNFVFPGIFVILFLWFVDTAGWLKRFDKPKETNNYYKNSGKKKKDDIVIRPKAKPNRVKNKDK